MTVELLNSSPRSSETHGTKEHTVDTTKVIVQDKFEDGSKWGSKGHIFEDPKVAEHYRRLYEEAKYEGLHRFDPEFEWEPAEEKRAMRKVEIGITFWAFIMFVALDLDRNNMGSATADNILDDLKLTTNDYNLGNTVFLVSFLLAEVPSQLISKWIGPDRWIPTQMVFFSIISISQCRLKNRRTFLVTRALLGIFQGGFIPDVCLWFSYFYTSFELPVRFAFFYSANPFTGAFGGLLAYAIFHLSGHNGWEGWRWVFFIEGLFTLTIGLLAFGLMPASPAQTKTLFYRKGWFSEREEKILVNRVLRDSPEKGLMNNRTPINLRGIWSALSNYDMWPLYMNRFIGDMYPGPVGTYLSLSLRHLGFSPFKTSLLGIPASFVSIFTMYVVPFLARRFKSNALAFLIKPLWVLPPLIALVAWPGAQIQPWNTYAVFVVMLSFPATSYQGVSWCSSNANSVHTRTVSTAIHNMFAQMAGVVDANIYRADDKPLYHRGNRVLIAIGVLDIFVILFAYFYYKWRNATKAKKWNALTPQEQIDYVSNTTDVGNKRLDFRFVL